MSKVALLKVKLKEGIDTASLFGSRDVHLKMIEEAFGIRVSARGEEVLLEGPPEAVRGGERLLGGLTTIALSAHAPELVRKVTLVDVTPGVDRDKAAPIAQFISGPETFMFSLGAFSDCGYFQIVIPCIITWSVDSQPYWNSLLDPSIKKERSSFSIWSAFPSEFV